MRVLASEASKKAAKGVLEKNPDRNREDVLRSKRVREKTMLQLKTRKTKFEKGGKNT